MQSKKILSIGFGDIARRYTHLFLRDGCDVTAIARSPKHVPHGVRYVKAAVESKEAAAVLTAEKYDAVIITLTPTGSDDLAYKEAYVDNMRHLIHVWESRNRLPEIVLFVSSSSVYCQSNGEWVDENSIVEPNRHNGKRLLEAENLLKHSRLNHCIVRFTGIYGPNRNYLIKKVKSGVKGGENYTNRIHSDDCAHVLHFLCNQYWQGNLMHRLYLASDSSPVKASDISLWLAENMGLGKTHLKIPSLVSRAGNKRCSNKRLLENGYRFIYPTFKEGYLQALEENDLLVTEQC